VSLDHYRRWEINIANDFVDIHIITVAIPSVEMSTHSIPHQKYDQK
jgi:hypothetical protein